MTGLTTRALAITLALIALGPAPASLAHPRWALRAGGTFDGERWRPGAIVVVHGDRIEALLDASQVPAGVPVTERPDAVVTPGLIDLGSVLGLDTRAGETQEAASPDLRVLDGFAADDDAEAAFRRSGVTTAWLRPGDTSVVGGAGALVQPARTGTRVLRAAWGLGASLRDASLAYDRGSTSLPARAELIRTTAATTTLSGPLRIAFDDSASARLGAAVPGAVLVGRPAGPAELDEILAARGLIVSGLGPDSDLATARGVVSLMRAGLRVALASEAAATGPRAVRTAAARLVAEGLSADAALAALTAHAADLAALPDGRGRLIAGAVADLVLWTADPTRPSARTLAVWVAGEEVHGD